MAIKSSLLEGQQFADILAAYHQTEYRTKSLRYVFENDLLAKNLASEQLLTDLLLAIEVAAYNRRKELRRNTELNPRNTNQDWRLSLDSESQDIIAKLLERIRASKAASETH